MSGRGAADLAQLFARPIAHRGLHDVARGVAENSRSAVAAAIAAGFGIEVDVQVTADGAAVVFHDDTLERMTAAAGPVAAQPAAVLTRLALKGSATGDTIWPLEELLEVVCGRAPLVIEVKTLWNGDRRLSTYVAGPVSRYRGPIALKSFDPLVLRVLRDTAPQIRRGIIGESFRDPWWHTYLNASHRFTLRHLLHWPTTRPDFISWDVNDLPRPAVGLLRGFARVPVMTWTVTSPAVAARARRHADQIVFQDFVPQPESRR